MPTVELPTLALAGTVLLSFAANPSAGRDPQKPGQQPQVESHAQDPGRSTGSNRFDQHRGGGKNAQGAGDGPFALDLDAFDPSPAAKLFGMVNPGITPEAVGVYGRLGVQNGLIRTDRRMDIVPNRVPHTAWVLQMGRDAGMRTLLTCVGTPQSNSTGNPPSEPWHTLPGYARTPPADMYLWADEIVFMLDELQSVYGILPDYVEIWNEPDRDEWWVGTDVEFLTLFAITSSKVKAAHPGVLVGGPGLAGAESGIGNEERFLNVLIENAPRMGFPLDFLSWHHYMAANELRYSDKVAKLRAISAQNGIDPQMIVSEWGLYPSTLNNPRAFELDGAHAAAQFAGFFSSAATLGLSANCYFMLHDVGNNGQFEVGDLNLDGTGVFTRHGIYKPVYRIMEFLYPMARQPRLTVGWPDNEWAVSLMATRIGDRVRMVLANDIVTDNWVWTRGCRERGAEPGVVWAGVEAVNALQLPLTVANLVQHGGLEVFEAQAAVEVAPHAEAARQWMKHPRTVDIVVSNGGLVPATAWRFDDTHNAPLNHRNALLPELQFTENRAQRIAWTAMESYLSGKGIQVPDPGTITNWPSNPGELALMLGIQFSTAEEAWNTFWRTLEEMRLDRVDFLNSLPETALQSEPPAQAGVSVAGNVVTVVLEPNSAMVIDFDVTP